MSQFYTDPSRGSDPCALPNAEVFYAEAGALELEYGCYDAEPSEAGFYYWPCFPGCMPDGEPIGPYESEDEAIEDARSWNDEENV